MTNYDERTQVSGSGGAPSYPESPTEVVGPRRMGGAPPRNDVTMIRPSVQRDPSFAWLVVVKGRRLGDVLPVKIEGSILGRETDSDIIIDDEYCSRHHAKVWVMPDPDANNEPAFFIQDLATANHTFVNGEEILRAKLVDGARVQIGETVMVFKKV